MKEQRTESPAGNSTYKKLAVQCLNDALYFASTLVVADSLVLRNRQLLVAAKRYGQGWENDNELNMSKNNNMITN